MTKNNPTHRGHQEGYQMLPPESAERTQVTTDIGIFHQNDSGVMCVQLMGLLEKEA